MWTETSIRLLCPLWGHQHLFYLICFHCHYRDNIAKGDSKFLTVSLIFMSVTLLLDYTALWQHELSLSYLIKQIWFEMRSGGGTETLRWLLRGRRGLESRQWRGYFGNAAVHLCMLLCTKHTKRQTVVKLERWEKLCFVRGWHFL